MYVLFFRYIMPNDCTFFNPGQELPLSYSRSLLESLRPKGKPRLFSILSWLVFFYFVMVRILAMEWYKLAYWVLPKIFFEFAPLITTACTTQWVYLTFLPFTMVGELW